MSDSKVILVTGATDGIGRETALELAKQGHTVLVHGRNERKVKEVVDAAKGAGARDAQGFMADFANFDSVRALASEVHKRVPHLDVLLNNAGVMMPSRKTTADGHETTWQVNHLSPFLLTNLLLPLLERSAPARIVNVSSTTHQSGEIDFDDLDREMDVSDVYAEWVTFEAGERGYALYSWDYPSYARSEPMSAYTTTSPSGAGASVDLTFHFAAPVRNLEFYTLGDQTDGRFAKVDVEMEDGSTDTTNLAGDGNSSTGERADLTDYDNVTSITIYEIEDAYSVNIDDISFEIRGEE